MQKKNILGCFQETPHLDQQLFRHQSVFFLNEECQQIYWSNFQTTRSLMTNQNILSAQLRENANFEDLEQLLMENSTVATIGKILEKNNDFPNQNPSRNQIELMSSHQKDENDIRYDKTSSTQPIKNLETSLINCLIQVLKKEELELSKREKQSLLSKLKQIRSKRLKLFDVNIKSKKRNYQKQALSIIEKTLQLDNVSQKILQKMNKHAIGETNYQKISGLINQINNR